jgi:serine/threonine protein phosphatase 1
VGTPLQRHNDKKNKMPVPQTFTKHLHLPANTAGKDYIVGDLHGCYDDLMFMLDHIGFNKITDRLFSVGDLVDRGPKSLECANLIYEDWVYVTRANHEQMMIDFLSNGTFTSNVNYGEGSSWIPNGGAWMKGEDHNDLIALARDLDMLPFVISVGEGSNRFNVVHAELKHFAKTNRHVGVLYIGNLGAPRIPVTDEMLDNWVFTPTEEYDMVWGREIISNGYPDYPPPADKLWHDPDKMSITYVGHTPVRQTMFVQNQMYIDNGAVFGRMNRSESEGNKLVIASPSEQIVYQLTMMYGMIARVPYSEIQRLG